MQHTLRSFVQSPPSRRRQYFERILALDELTDLIGRAVIGNAKLPGFKSPQGSYGLLQWESLIGQLKNPEAQAIAQKVKSLSQNSQPKALSDALIRLAVLEFSSPDTDLAEVEGWWSSSNMQPDKSHSLLLHNCARNSGPIMSYRLYWQDLKIGKPISKKDGRTISLQRR